jgi:hypothetical protein
MEKTKEKKGKEHIFKDKILTRVPLLRRSKINYRHKRLTSCHGIGQ